MARARRVSRAAWILVASAAAWGCRAGSSAGSNDHLSAEVSGLIGTGLVLHADFGEDLTVRGDGRVTFATALPDGTPFRVTVGREPVSPAQTCALGGADGTMRGGADVTVTCSTDLHRVRGTVTGLTGHGLALDDGVEEVTVDADGPFVFPTPLASGQAYAVTVGAGPAPWQPCTVAGATGAVGATDVTSVQVTCGPSSVVQGWSAPTRWGAAWPDDPAMLEHATFDGTTLVETRGLAWTVAGAPPPQRAFGGFPAGVRYGAGPFDPGHHFRAAAAGALDVPGDLLVCAVVRPQLNPVADPQERVILAKGMANESGWVLMQMHRSFCFHYEGAPPGNAGTGAGGSGTWMVWTEAHLGDLPGAAGALTGRELNPSYVVVCAGRDGDAIRVAVNSVPDTLNTTPLPPGPLVPSPRAATLGGYDGDYPDNAYLGRVYEAAVWSEPATPGNMQRRMAAVLGLELPDGTVARYTRASEAPFVGADGAYHTAGRHAPRIDPAHGMRFGLQGWNRVVEPEALALWSLGGASVTPDQLQPPGDSERASAALVTLAPGQTLSPVLWQAQSFAPGPVLAQLWIHPVSPGGTLRLGNAVPGGGAPLDLDFASPPPGWDPGGWNRVLLRGLVADGSGNANLALTAPAGPVTFHAWGAVLTQLGGGAGPATLDPGPGLYSWRSPVDPEDPVTGPEDPAADVDDVLTLPPVPGSTAGTGACLGVTARSPDGLPWTGGLAVSRIPLQWTSPDGARVAGFRVEPGPGGRLCFEVTSPAGAWASCADGVALGPGTTHALRGCVGQDGALRLLVDGAEVGAPSGAGGPASALELAGGTLTVGSGRDRTQPGWPPRPWHGDVAHAQACRGSDLAGCGP